MSEEWLWAATHDLGEDPMLKQRPDDVAPPKATGHAMAAYALDYGTGAILHRVKRGKTVRSMRSFDGRLLLPPWAWSRLERGLAEVKNKGWAEGKVAIRICEEARKVLRGAGSLETLKKLVHTHAEEEELTLKPVRMGASCILHAWAPEGDTFFACRAASYVARITAEDAAGFETMIRKLGG